MQKPVYSKICKSRHHFDRMDIEDYINSKSNNRCPICNKPLSVSDLLPDKILETSIQEWQQNQIGQQIDCSNFDLSDPNGNLSALFGKKIELEMKRDDLNNELKTVNATIEVIETNIERLITPLLVHSKFERTVQEKPVTFTVTFKKDTKQDTINEVLSKIGSDSTLNNATTTNEQQYIISMEENKVDLFFKRLSQYQRSSD